MDVLEIAMRVIESIGDISEPFALCLGAFDESNRMDRTSLRLAYEESIARGAHRFVMAFSDGAPGQPVETLFTADERAEIWAGLGADSYLSERLTRELADMTPAAFMEYLSRFDLCRLLCVREHFWPEGVDSLRGQTAIPCRSMPASRKQDLDKRITECIEAGDFEQAETMMGLKYFISGVVEQGNHLGHEIGFPTANIVPHREKTLPPDGVYATEVEIVVGKQKNLSKLAMTNIGKNPTVHGTVRKVESYILDFQGSLYGRTLKVTFVKRLRDEMQFGSLEELRAQLREDRNRVMEISQARD
jgi:riboflavin kinase/FMN adenylyltransferase